MARRRTRSIFHTAATVRTAAEPGFNEEGGVDTGWGDLTYLVPNPDDFPDGPTMEEWLDSLPADEKMVLPEAWLDAQASRSAELRQREAAILQAMGKATLPEQRQLLGELNAIRTERTAMVQASRDIDLANATISDHLTPVASLGARSSAKSDWLAEVPTYNPGDLTHTMVAEASLFFRALHPAVKADAEELVIQSLGKARQVASQFERQSRVAVEAFMDEIVRLAEAQPAAEPAEDGAAESSLPVAVNPSDAPETFDEDTLGAVSDSQMADSDFAQKYQSSRSTAATLAAMNETMWARLGAADDEPWADDDTDDTDPEGDATDDTGGETEEEDEDDDDSPFPKESVRKTASYMEIAGAYGRDYKSLKDAKADWDANKDFQILDAGPNMGRYINKAQLSELPAGTTLMVRFKAMTEVREIAKSAARRTAVSLTNVGLDGENGIGTDPQGNRVRFKLSPQDRKDLSSVLFSDMAVNFTGVDVEESDIIRSASRRTASGDYCPKCGSSESTMQSSGALKCNSCGHEHLIWQRTDKKAARKTAARALSEIAKEIRRDWKNVYFGAEPYLDAMGQLNGIDDNYYQDPASDIVNYFLSNASGWRGETAKAIKAELKGMLGRKASRRTAGAYDDYRWVYVDGGRESGWFSDSEKDEMEGTRQPGATFTWRAITDAERASMNSWYAEQSYAQSSLRTASNVDSLRQIVDTKTMGDVGGQTMDTFSASAILSVLDALSPENQATFTKVIETNPAKAADVAFKLLNSQGKGAAKTAASPEGWWPLTPSRRNPGEDALTCPACNSQNVSITGSNLGRDVLMGNNYTQLVCRDCGKRQTYPRPAPKGLGHNGQPLASRRTAADEPSESGAAESSLPVAVNPSDAPEGLDQLTDGSGDAPSGAAAGSPTTFADFVADRSKLSVFRQRVAAKTAMPNPADMGVKVGDIFDAQWGYDQTNVDFYEVVGLTGASVKVRPIDKKTHGTPTQWAVRQVMPIPGAYIGGVMTKRIQDYSDRPSFNVDASSSAYLWDGKPITETSYA